MASAAMSKKGSSVSPGLNMGGQKPGKTAGNPMAYTKGNSAAKSKSPVGMGKSTGKK